MNQRIAYCFALFLAPAIAVAACGGGQAEPTQPSNPSGSSSAPSASAPAESAAPSASQAAPAASATPAASASAAPAGPPGPGDWAKWSHDQKLAYMKSDVMPKMAKTFHDYDAKKYDEPKCVLCHGAGVKDGSFTMPNPDLPKLDLTPAGFAKMQKKKPKVVEFMIKDVEHGVAGLLGEDPYDPKTGKGFGCAGCHTVVTAKK
jgi:hypothetical protein